MLLKKKKLLFSKRWKQQKVYNVSFGEGEISNSKRARDKMIASLKVYGGRNMLGDRKNTSLLGFFKLLSLTRSKMYMEGMWIAVS